MRNLRGLIVTAVFGVLTLILRFLADRFDVLMGMAYPFFSKTIMEFLAQLTGKADLCMWQIILAIYLGVVAVSVALMILFRWNFFRWLGAVLAPAAVAVFLLTALWGLNYYNRPIQDSMRLEVVEATSADLQEAALYYRGEAEKLSDQLSRDKAGDLVIPDLGEMNGMAAQAYDDLVMKYSIFAGPRGPIKELGWADSMSAMGIDGLTVGLTGEGAVNPNLYPARIPMELCRQIAHLLAFPREGESEFAAYLACEMSQDPTFRYCGYVSAFLNCSNALYETDKIAWKQVWEEVNRDLRHDVEAMNAYDTQWDGKQKQRVQESYDEILKRAELEEDDAVYYTAHELLVSWYIENYRPVEEIPVNPFDPTDYEQVFPAEGVEEQ